MISVVNEAVSFEAAPVAAAQEQMTTACSMWASVEPRLVLQIKLTANFTSADSWCSSAAVSDGRVVDASADDATGQRIGQGLLRVQRLSRQVVKWSR